MNKENYYQFTYHHQPRTEQRYQNLIPVHQVHHDHGESVSNLAFHV